MIYCQDCGAANDVAGTFCRICGRNLSPGARIAPLPNVQSATRQSSRVLLLVWRRGCKRPRPSLPTISPSPARPPMVAERRQLLFRRTPSSRRSTRA